MIALICYFSFNGNIFFTQTRIGRNEKPFTIIKFISMRPPEKNTVQSDTDRITATGKFLRKLSLDELPQLFNIIKGDMSFIGPRPLLEQYLPYYRKEERKRHSVRPGITGLAQISGRNMVNWDDRLKLDAAYVEHLNIFMDLKILFKTAMILFKPGMIQTDPRSAMQDLDAERKNEHL